MEFINNTDCRPRIACHRLANLRVLIDNNLTVLHKYRSEGEQLHHTIFRKLLCRDILLIDYPKFTILIHNQIVILRIRSHTVPINNPFFYDIAFLIRPIKITVYRQNCILRLRLR